MVTLVPDPAHPNIGGRTAFAAAVNFERDISDVVLRGALAYYSDNRIGGAQDPSGYNLGLQVGFKGFTFGGNYTRGDNIDHRTTYLDQSQTNIWSAGMTYGAGPWVVGVNYADGEDKVPGAGGDFSSLVGALSYKLNSHVKLGLGYQHDDASPKAISGANGDALFMETGLKF
jgi:predicted porin